MNVSYDRSRVEFGLFIEFGWLAMKQAHHSAPMVMRSIEEWILLTAVHVSLILS